MKLIDYLKEENIHIIGTDSLSVGGYLDLRGTAITSLPDSLSVGGYLDLRGTAITSLPDSLSVGGSLDLRGTAITSLPGGIRLEFRGAFKISFPVRGDELTVGCTRLTLDEWLSGYKTLASKYSLSDVEFNSIKSVVVDCIKKGWLGSTDMLEKLT